MKDKILSLVDVETTGGSPTKHRVIEVAVIQMLNNEVINSFTQLVNPRQKLPQFISGLTGIHDHMLEDQPLFDEIAPQLYTMLEDTIFVAHNARFDYSFLRQEFSRLDMTLTLPTLCTVRLSRKLFPRYQRHGLDSLIERFNFDMDDRHRAFADTDALRQFFQILPTHHSEDKIQETVSQLMKKYVLPSHVPEKELNSLHTGPGVYIFYGDDGLVLYVGKSIHVKERVFQHFSKAHDSSKEMSMLHNMRHIETIPTASELGALLLESKLVKELQPVHNRMLRRLKDPHALVSEVNDDGYLVPKETSLGSVSPEEFDSIIGLYYSKKNMNDVLLGLQKDHHLCPKLLGLEKTKRACFLTQLDKCFGACCGQEDALAYNIRFQEAFEKSRIQTWPFAGPIMITEYADDQSSGEVFFINQWCLLAWGTFEDGEISFKEERSMQFNRDHYRILLSYLSKSRNLRKVQEVSLEKMTEMMSA